MTGLPPHPLSGPPPSERATPSVIYGSFAGCDSETTKHHTPTNCERVPSAKASNCLGHGTQQLARIPTKAEGHDGQVS